MCCKVNSSVRLPIVNAKCKLQAEVAVMQFRICSGLASGQPNTGEMHTQILNFHVDVKSFMLSGNFEMFRSCPGVAVEVRHVKKQF